MQPYLSLSLVCFLKKFLEIINHIIVFQYGFHATCIRVHQHYTHRNIGFYEKYNWRYLRLNLRPFIRQATSATTRTEYIYSHTLFLQIIFGHYI